jgi:transposase InsO family protein
MPTNVKGLSGFRLYSQKWGDARSTPLPFADKWQRLREAARAKGLSRDARKRLEWFLWYETIGQRNARATCRHFGIAPKIFYFWQKRFDEKHLEVLEERSRRPHHLRPTTLTTDEELRIRELRKEYLCYSKLKLAILYKERYGVPISSWKIQQVIQRYKLYPNPKRAENTAKKRQRAVAKKRITELVKEPATGFLFCLDTIVLHWGAKRYILTAIDRHSRLAYARMYTTHSSLNAADFLRRLHLLVDGRMVHVQTDNGSEFHKHFETAIAELELQHWWSRVRTPKDNAVLERFNRTIQEEFIQQGNAYVDIQAFNARLTEWLVEYDFHRPHMALGYRRPIEIACGDEKALPMYSSRTTACYRRQAVATCVGGGLKVQRVAGEMAD